MKFRYFKEGDSVGDHGSVHRIAAEESAPYLLDLERVAYEREDGTTDTVKVKTNNVKLDPKGDTADVARAAGEAAGHVFKFKEVTFKEWSHAPEWATNEAGNLIDPVNGPLDAETGEPVVA